VPSAPVSVAVALADKIDTLTGFWAIDEKPTGSKDPYALRRAALGVIRLVLGNGLNIPLFKILVDRVAELERREHDEIVDDEVRHEHDVARYLGLSVEEMNDVRRKSGKIISREDDPVAWKASMDRLFSGIDWSQVGLPGETTARDLLAFLHDRLKVHLKDEGIRHDVIDACLAMPFNDDLTLLVHRARALGAFLSTDDGENLVQGFKRANNILRQAEEKDGVEYSYGADVKFAETDEEKALFAALDTAEPQIAAALKSEDFAGAMRAMAALRPAVDAFFEGVQVNVDNAVLRRNRLNLLSRIRTICLQAADLSLVEG
jgi:glycyl-tRNA synthetase beta chain